MKIYYILDITCSLRLLFVRGFFALVECFCCVTTCNLWLSSLSKQSQIIFAERHHRFDFLSFFTVSFVFISTVACQNHSVCVFLYLYIVLLNLKSNEKYSCYQAPLILFYSMCINKSGVKWEAVRFILFDFSSYMIKNMGIKW